MVDLWHWLSNENWTEIGVIGAVLVWTGKRVVASLKAYIKGEFDYHRETMKKDFYPRDIAEERHSNYIRRFVHLEDKII